MTSLTAATAVEAVARISIVPDILRAMSQVTGLRTTAVARVTDTQWVACAVRDEAGFGLLPAGELVVESTICNEIRQHGQPVVFGRASAHPHFSQHPTPRHYGLESCISVPIFHGDQRFFGTLCALDRQPRDELEDPDVLRMVRLLADLIGRQLDIEGELARQAAHLRHAQEAQRLRELLTTLIDRDLRDPLQAIVTGLYLARGARDLGEEEQANLAFMEASCQRIIALLRDLHDFAGGNLQRMATLNPAPGTELAQELARVLERMGGGHPGRVIHAEMSIGTTVNCDRVRLARLLESLVADVLLHADPAHAVTVKAGVAAGRFQMDVAGRARAGTPPLREDDPARLHAFIAGEIARAHHGQLSRVVNGDGQLRAAFEMPAEA